MLTNNIRQGLTVATALAILALAQTTSESAAQTRKSLQAKVTRFVQAYVRSSGLPNPKVPRSKRRFVDLNGDGTPEALVILRGGNWCGARGCSAFVLDLRGAKARSIGDFIAQELKPLRSRTGRWRDISLNGYRMRYRAGKYAR